MAKKIKNVLLSLLLSLIALAAADILLLLAGIKIPVIAALLGFIALTAFLIFFKPFDADKKGTAAKITVTALFIILSVISLAEINFMNTAGYRNLKKDDNSLFANKRVMFIVPHEADDYALAGGIIEQYAKSKSDVYVVFTDESELNNDTVSVLKSSGIKASGIICDANINNTVLQYKPEIIFCCEEIGKLPYNPVILKGTDYENAKKAEKDYFADNFKATQSGGNVIRFPFASSYLSHSLFGSKGYKQLKKYGAQFDTDRIINGDKVFEMLSPEGIFPYEFIKITDDNGDFVYDYIIDESGSQSFSVYSPNGEKEINDETFTVEATNSRCDAYIKDGKIVVECEKGLRTYVVVTDNETGAIDRVHFINPTDSKKAYLHFMQRFESRIYEIMPDTLIERIK